MTEKELLHRIDMVKVCGANRGPHDYIPVHWLITPTSKVLNTLMCRVCFQRIRYQTLFEYFDEVKI